MLKKLIIFTLAIVILAGGAAPFVVSKMIEKQYNQNISQLNAFYKDEITLTGHFEGGYLTSKATTEVKHNASATSYKLHHAINNGPVILNSSSHMPEAYALATINTTFDDDINTILMQNYKGKKGYDINTVIDYSGNGTTNLKLDPLAMDMVDSSVDWKGLQLVLLHSKDCSSLTGNITMPGITYAENGADSTSVKKVEGKDFKLGFSTGVNAAQESVDVNLGDLTILHGEEVIFNAKKLVFTGKLQTTASLLKCDFTYGFEQLSIMKDQYGPLSYSMGLKNLDKDFFKTMASQGPELNAAIGMNNNATMGVIDPNQSAAAMMNYPPEQAIAFLSLRPGVTIDFKLQLPNGKILLQASMDIGGPQIKEMDEEAIKASITGASSFKIDQAVLYMLLTQYAQNNIKMKEEAFAMDPANQGLPNPYTYPDDKKQSIVENWIITLLDKLKESRFIVENDAVISSDATYDKSVLTINAQEKSSNEVKAMLSMFEDIVSVSSTAGATPAAGTPAAVMPGTLPATTMPSTTPDATTIQDSSLPTMAPPDQSTPDTTMPVIVAPDASTPDSISPDTTLPSTMPSTVPPSTNDSTNQTNVVVPAS